MELPEVQHLEDPQNRSDAPVTQPWRMALRNSGAALLGIGALMFAQWLVYFNDFRGAVAWWMWVAAVGFAVVVCFTHAMLAVWLGGRRAGMFLMAVVVLALAGMLFAVWWSLQSKNGV